MALTWATRVPPVVAAEASEAVAILVTIESRSVCEREREIKMAAEEVDYMASYRAIAAKLKKSVPGDSQPAKKGRSSACKAGGGWTAELSRIAARAELRVQLLVQRAHEMGQAGL